MPGNSPESSKHAYILSTSAIPLQHHSSTASSNLSSSPHSVPDIHVERSRNKALARAGSMTGKDPRDGRPGRIPQSTSGSFGGSYGKIRGLMSKKGGGGFLLGMGGANFPHKQVERDGLRSASDPIARPPMHSSYPDYYSRTEAPSSSSPSQRHSVEQNALERENADNIGFIGGTSATVNSNTSHLDEIFTDGDNTAARMVKMAEGSSENRRSLYGGRTKEAINLVPGRSLSSGSRESSSRPILTSTASQGVPIEFRWQAQTSQTQPEAPQLFNIEAQYLDHQTRYQAQTQMSPPLRLTQPLSHVFPFQQQQSRVLPFNQVQIPYSKLNISASTIARAAKARQYLELFTQYIDLLSSIPPAKDTPNLPYNQQQQQSYYHHNTSQQLVQSQHPLRKYNPLQTIRNRRLRNRQGLGQLDLTPWEDSFIVESWVESTINAFKEALQAPQETQDYSSSQKRLNLPSPPNPRPLEKGKSKPKRSKLDWVVHPSEMFADFYWMNGGAGKYIMEDRFGGRIFPKGPASAVGSNNSIPTSAGARGSLEKARASGRGKISQEEQNAPGRWSMEYGERDSNSVFGMGLSGKVDNQEDHNSPNRRNRSLSLTRDTTRSIHGGSIEGIEDVPSHKRSGQAGDLSLPTGPGITIGIGGGYVSPDDSPYDEESGGESHDERKEGRPSMESRRYSSQIEDDVVPGEIPLRRMFFESPDRMGSEKISARKRHHHHHHLYRFGHYRKSTKGGGVGDSSASSLDLSAVDSSDSGASESRRDRKWISSRRHEKTTKADNTVEMDGSAEEDLTADGEEIEGVEESRLPKSSPFIRKLKQKTRREKHPASKNRPVGDSDYDTSYESAAAMSRSPSPAVTQYKEPVPNSSLDDNTKALDFPHASPLQSRTTLVPQLSDKGSKNPEPNPGNLNASPYLAAPSSGRTPGEERGRGRKNSKDDGLGIFFKRAISPMKLARKSGDYIRDEEIRNFEKRDSKDSERDTLPSLERDKDKDKKSRTKGTVKKAAEKVGNRVERIKNGVGGLVWGKEVPQSVQSSNYTSSMDSASGASDKEGSDEDAKEKPRKSKLSVDLDGILRIQKRSKFGDVKQLSGANLEHLDTDLEAATPSDASIDGDGDELGRRGLSNKNDELPKLDVPKLKIMGPSRENFSVIRRTGSGLIESGSYEKMRPGGVRLRREKSRLGEEIKGDSDSTAIEKRPVLAPLGRVTLPNIAAVPRRGSTHGAPTKRRYMGKKDIARARALMLSTGILARGMATQTQTLEQKATAGFIGTLQITAHHHTISAKHLSSQIHSSAQNLDSKILAFRTATLSHLRSQFLGIQDEVSARLTPLVQTTADDADVLSGELSTRYVLEVKRLNDEVSTLARRRRRTTLKWMRRGGYVLLEWVVLGVMWWVWLIVVMVRMVRVVVGGIGRGLKWIVLWK
ncbi:hypothetical protein EV426DRAFT_702822 [Tirmania nivea]|nr:hypothetical protein EV426DRAFT_702822 [Tirmania nivea]